MNTSTQCGTELMNAWENIYEHPDAPGFWCDEELEDVFNDFSQNRVDEQTVQSFMKFMQRFYPESANVFNLDMYKSYGAIEEYITSIPLNITFWQIENPKQEQYKIETVNGVEYCTWGAKAGDNAKGSAALATTREGALMAALTQVLREINSDFLQHQARSGH